MRFGATLAANFLIFIPALLLASVRAEDDPLIIITAPKEGATLISGDVVWSEMKANPRLGDHTRVFGVWLQNKQSGKDALFDTLFIRYPESIGGRTPVPELDEGMYDILVVHEHRGTPMAKPVSVHVKKKK